jgi:sugar phosphate isomerase/epimerase
VFVACSTDCFANQPLPEALRAIGEIGFNKIDVTAREGGQHLAPSEVAADVGRAAQRLRGGTGLTVAAFRVELADGLTRDQAADQLKSMCRLARVLATPLVSLPSAAAGSCRDAEVERLTGFNRLAQAEGVSLAVETLIGTLTEDPAVAVELCERVPGLGLTLDPSHYIAGPHQGKPIDAVFPFVRHVHLRDTGRGPDQFQVRVGQGEVEYGRIVAQLSRCRYERALSVDVRDVPDSAFPMAPEVRKLKYLLESLV